MLQVGAARWPKLLVGGQLGEPCGCEGLGTAAANSAHCLNCRVQLCVHKTCSPASQHTPCPLPAAPVQGRELPAGRRDAVGGVWVVGISKGSAAEQAGVVQGDELLVIDGQSVEGSDPISPFQASSLIAGPDDASMPTMLTLEVRRCLLRRLRGGHGGNGRCMAAKANASGWLADACCTRHSSGKR